VSQTSSSASTAAAQATNPTTAGAVASTNSSAGYTTTTHISSLEDLKKKAPEVYNQTLKSIGMKICNDMKRHQDHLKETMRRGYQK
jgi:hypothetical protein